MKRRYKEGDWLRVPLGGELDALAIIAQASRSRLFGYFFAIPASQVPSHGDLRALRRGDAIAALPFLGAALEDARWPIVAASLAFDREAWPLPEAFASRCAFDQAHFASPHEVQAALRRRIAGAPAPRTSRICEIRSPVDPQRLRAVEAGGRVQFSTPLSAPDLAWLASFMQANPQVALRVHGFRHGFDATQLARFTALRDLALDVHRLQHAPALAALHELRALRIGAMQIDLSFLEELAKLRVLELRGTRASLEGLGRLASLESLMLESTAPLDLRGLACAGTLQRLVLAHGEYDLREIGALANLRRLELRALDAARLAPLGALVHLEQLHLDGLTHIADLRPLAQLPLLRELRVTAMPQLTVSDFEPLRACAGLRTLDVEVGSRRKAREIYRLLKDGE